MYVKTLVPPPFDPITLAEAYEHLRWDTELVGSPAEVSYPLETLVTRNISSATAHVEKSTGRSLIERTLQIVTSKFPDATAKYQRAAGDWTHYEAGGAWIELLKPPILGPVTVEYYDDTNVLTTLDASNYFIVDDVVPRLQFATGFSAPAVYLRDDAVRITYRAGYDAVGSPPTSQADYAANVPQRLKDAILITLQLLVDRFDATEREAMERTRRWLIDDYIVYVLR